MGNRCRVCQRSEVDELISLSFTDLTQELCISEMISKTTGAMLDDYDRLPQQLCDKCLGWLDQTYSLWKRLRVQPLLEKCEKGEEESYHRCRICARNDSDELVSLFCICDPWEVSIDRMIYFLTNVKVESGDCLPPYICDVCLQDLDIGYGFKKQYLDSEAAFREEIFFAWEKMVFQASDSSQLVVDLEAEMIPNWETQGAESITSVDCSVCKLKIPLDQVSEQCIGCLLKFNNIADVRKKINVYGQMDSSDKSIGIDYEPGELSLDDDTSPIEAPSTRNHTSNFKYKANKKLFDLIGNYSDSPFQKILRKGPICCGCNKIFPNNKEVSDHLKTMHSKPRGSGSYSCERCLKKYSTLIELNRHKNRSNQYIVDYCKACQKYFPRANDFLLHQEKFHMPIRAAKAAAGKYTVEKQSLYECCVKACKRQFNGKEQLLQHCNKCHRKEKGLNRNTCQYCGLHFEKDDDLITHSNRNVESMTYCCTINGCILRTKRLARIRFHCSEVPHVPYSRSKLRALKRGPTANKGAPICGAAGRYIGVKQVSYRCCGLGCKLRFSTEALLLQHMGKSHPQSTEVTSNTCQHCGSHFTHETVLLNHHSNRKLEWTKYICTIDCCGFKAKTEGAVKKHCSTQHTSTLLKAQRQNKFDVKQQSVGKKVVVNSYNEDTTAAANEIAAEKYAVVSHVYYGCCAADCNNRYKNEELLLQHSNMFHYQVDSSEHNTCQCCGLHFDHENILSQHNSDRKVQWITYNCKIDGCSFNSKVLETTRLHCDQNPHEKSTLSPRLLRNATPDMKHFTVTGDIDGIIDVLERTTSEVCCKCFIFFETPAEWLLHYDEHHAIIKDNNPFRCGNCNTGFLHEGVMQHHILSKGPENRTYYFCHPCQSFFWDDLQLKHHRAKIHASSNELYEQDVEELLMCCGCEKQFIEEEELIEHRRVQHTPPSKRPPWTNICDACQKTFKNSATLEEHKTLYSSNHVYRCKVAGCAYQTKKLTTIKIHAAGSSHRDINGKTLFIVNIAPKEYRCCVYGCGYTNVSYDAVIEHGISEHDPKRAENKITYTMHQFICPVCCKCFINEVRLINHQNRTKKQYCQFCGIICKIEEYDGHLVICSKQAKVTCEICYKVLNSRSLLQHMQEMHVDEKRKQEPKSVCPICGKRYAKHHLPTHMSSHENKRQWKCKLCPMGFNTKGQLGCHSRVHTDVKNFECRHGCGNRYKFEVDRVRHEKQVHLGIKPFKCQYCPESFVRERDLRLHSRKHTGLKLYTCKLCTSGFNLLSEFKTHMEECS